MPDSVHRCNKEGEVATLITNQSTLFKNTDSNKKTLEDQEKRLTALEVSDGRIITMVENLVKAVDGLVTWIKGLVGTIALTGIGFIIWYIQSL